MLLQQDDEIPQQLSVIRCQCPAVTCRTYGFREGMFYQGCGFNEKTALRVAGIYNECKYMDNPVEVIRGALSILRDVTRTKHHESVTLRVRARQILKMAGE